MQRTAIRTSDVCGLRLWVVDAGEAAALEELRAGSTVAFPAVYQRIVRDVQTRPLSEHVLRSPALGQRLAGLHSEIVERILRAYDTRREAGAAAAEPDPEAPCCQQSSWEVEEGPDGPEAVPRCGAMGTALPAYCLTCAQSERERGEPNALSTLRKESVAEATKLIRRCAEEMDRWLVGWMVRDAGLTLCSEEHRSSLWEIPDQPAPDLRAAEELWYKSKDRYRCCRCQELRFPVLQASCCGICMCHPCLLQVGA